MNSERKVTITKLRKSVEENSNRLAFELLPTVAIATIYDKFSAGYCHTEKIQKSEGKHEKSSKHLYKMFLQRLKTPLIYRCGHEAGIWVEFWALNSLDINSYLPKDLKERFFDLVLNHVLEPVKDEEDDECDG